MRLYAAILGLLALTLAACGAPAKPVPNPLTKVVIQATASQPQIVLSSPTY
jgi:hypothetical protein